ncbi:MAG: hypothetical protein ABW157_21635 [Candidatus Thiodiazotropha sp. LLP2]
MGKSKRKLRIQCPHCNLRLGEHDLLEHIRTAHPTAREVTPSKIKKLKFRELAKIRKEQALAKLPKIHCNICGKEIARGKYKSHRIKEHGASKVIMEKRKPTKKKQQTQFSETNIAKPFQGGSPGQGKRK